MRDILIVVVILLNLPVGIVKPYYGILVYAWVSYMYPQMLAWSFATRFPVAKMAAISALVGTVLNRAADFRPLRERENILMIVLWGLFTLSSVFAVYQTEAWRVWQDVTKLLIMCLLTSMFLTDQKRVRYFLLVVALSIGFYGVKGGIFSIKTAGVETVFGPGTSVMGANNSIGLALNMAIPMLWYLSTETKGWLKRILQLTFLISIPAVMFTYSRASAITLGIVLLALILKGRNAVVLLCIFLMAAIVAVPSIPRKWWRRQETVINYEEDRSAMSRVDNWKFCWKVAVDNPLVGAGFEFGRRDMFLKYAPQFLQVYGKAFNTHNIYLSILASHGFPAFAVYLAMIGFAIISCQQLKNRVKGRPDLKWVSLYADIVHVSMLAFLINGMFVNMEYFDLPFHLVGLTASLKVVVSRALAEEPVEEGAMPELAPAAAT